MPTIHEYDAVTSAATADEILLWQVANSLTKRITKANFLGGALSGGGTIATGGYTLTVPATGTAALLSAANIFQTIQRINAPLGVGKAASGAMVEVKPSTAALTALSLDTQASPTAAIVSLAVDGVRKGGLFSTGVGGYSATVVLRGIAFDNGSGAGLNMTLDRNSNASTPASGYFNLQDLAGNYNRIWVDATGAVRVHNADPTNANDTAGTVVGAQTSWIGLKEDVEPWDSDDDALHTVVETPLYTYKFRKDAGNPGRVYHGLVIENRDEWFAVNTEENQTPALDERSLFGYLIASIKALTARVEQLEAQISSPAG